MHISAAVILLCEVIQVLKAISYYSNPSLFPVNFLQVKSHSFESIVLYFVTLSIH